MKFWITFWLVIQTLDVLEAIYSPALTWDVCSPSRIVVTLTGAEVGGIIYIRGYGATCRQTTSANDTQHVFDFQACGIVTGETYFTIIVQKSPLYQTGSDLQESLLCIYDLSDITVGTSANTGDKDDDAGVNKTIKPTGYMVLYNDGMDIGGQNVKLSDLVTMTIELDAQYIDDFDIKVKSCTANFIELILSYCSGDSALFPNFRHISQGVVTSTFGAFRTTDLGGGYVQMIFSCTVEVCQGPCSLELCTNGEDGWGRKRRAADDVRYDELSIGASFSVGTEKDDQPNVNDPMDHICIDNTIFILLLLAILGVLVTSLCLTVHVTTRLLKRNDELRNLTGINKRQRKSLIHVVNERRKSSLSILPGHLIQTRESTPRCHSQKIDALREPSPRTLSALTTEINKKDEEKSKFERNIEPESVGIASGNLVNVVKDSSITKFNTSTTSTRLNMLMNLLDGKAPESQRPVLKTNHTPEHVVIRPGTMTSISGQLDDEPNNNPSLEKLLGLNSRVLVTMTKEEKQYKLLECQALLKRLTQTQKRS